MPAGAVRSTVDRVSAPAAQSAGYLDREDAVGDAGQVLDAARTVVMVDWPAKYPPFRLAP